MERGHQRRLNHAPHVRSLLLRPGQLSREYLDGRTRWYLPPIRLYLFTFALMLFVRSFTGVEEAARREIERGYAAQVARDPRLAELRAREAVNGRAGIDEAVNRGTNLALNNQWLRLVDPLTVGVLLALLFWGPRRGYAEHVLFALHLMAFNWVGY